MGRLHPDYWIVGCECPFCRTWMLTPREGHRSMTRMGYDRFMDLYSRHAVDVHSFSDGNVFDALERAARYKVAAQHRVEDRRQALASVYVKKRPTFMEVVDRDSEIVNWNIKKDAYLVKQAKVIDLWRYTTGLCLLMVFPLLFFASPWMVFPDMAATMAALAMTVRAISRYTYPYRAIGMPPCSLEIDKLTDLENEKLMYEQGEQEPFRSVCACPTCGYFDYHEVEEAKKPVHEWVRAIRTCKLCGRKWGQS